MAIYLHVFFEPLVNSSEVDFYEIFELAGVEDEDAIATAITDCETR